MKIAFTAEEGSWDAMIDPRLGRAEFIVTFDEDSQSMDVIDNRSVKNEAHGAGTAMVKKLYDLKPDVLITGNGPGATASVALRQLDIRIFVDAHGKTLRDAYQLYRDGKLNELPVK